MEKLSSKDHYFRIYRKTMDNFICLIAHWELTYNCNLKCRHCYVTRNGKRQEFSLTKAKGVLDELSQLGCLYLVFSGGEILTRDDFFDMASYARSQGFALRLMTNATLIDETVADKIASLYPLSVETSIYAAHKDLHDTITGTKGSFHRTIEAAELLRERKVKVLLKFLIMRDNKEEFPLVKSLAKAMGADFLFDFCLVKRNDGSASPLKYRLNRDEIKDFLVKNHISPTRKDDSEEALLCTAGLNNIFITPYLDVYPCIGLKEKAGNLWNDNLKDIWWSTKLHSIRNIKLSDLHTCRRCDVIQFCDRCTGTALSEDGDMFGPSRFDCTVAQLVRELYTKRKEAGAYETQER